MSSSSFIRALAEQIEADRLFERNARLMVAVSGGSDSMALLHGLVGLNRLAGYGLALHVAHLNHSLRGEESDGDAAFVGAEAEKLGLPCTIERIDVRTRAHAESGSLEEIARRCRYQFFEEVCRQDGHARLVALGHQADDDAETILHRIIRGTGWRGLSGIPRRRPLREGSPCAVVRPLLRFSRRELLEFLSDQGVSHREDRTNASDEPTRNQIRNVVLPLLESRINPQVRAALLRIGDQAEWLGEFLSETVERVFDTLVISQTDQELALNAATLAGKSRVLQTEIVRRAVRSLGAGEQSLRFGNVVPVTRLLADHSGNRRVHLPGGITVTRCYDRLVFARPTQEPHEELAEEVAIHVPGVTKLPVRRLEIECEIDRLDRTLPVDWRHHPRGEEWLDQDALHYPLVIRGRRTGDRFWPLGAPGTRRLSEFLADAKVNPVARAQVTLLCDQLGPIYVIGYRIDERVKLTSATRNVLHVRVHALDPAG